ncbi:serine protease [Lobulomyces angularis]|nr:serine protease [Lobulomyces angularis]
MDYHFGAYCRADDVIAEMIREFAYCCFVDAFAKLKNLNFNEIQLEDININSFKLTDFFNFDGFNAYVGDFCENAIKLLSKDEDVDFIEQDQFIQVDEKFSLQLNSTWNLQRITTKNFGNNNIVVDDTNYRYLYPTTGGKNVNVYIVDTGVNIHHQEFEGRAIWGATIPQDDPDQDGNGHGTHVAGIVGSKSYGVAKKSTLIAVKVLKSNGGGSLSDVVKGVEWLVRDHKRRNQIKKVFSVANMSVGGGRSRVLDKAVEEGVEAGITFSVASGNEGQNSCSYSPGASDKVITVGASTPNDEVASYSNHGDCVDIYAPGSQILSTYMGASNSIMAMDGTSQASPHVAGLIAILLSLPKYQNFTQIELKEFILSKLFIKDTLTKFPIWAGGQKSNKLLFFGDDLI